VVEIVPVADMRQVTLTWPIIFESVKDKETNLRTTYHMANYVPIL